MKKVVRIILLVLLGVLIVGTFVFLWQKSRPLVAVYDVLTPSVQTIA